MGSEERTPNEQDLAILRDAEDRISRARTPEDLHVAHDLLKRVIYKRRSKRDKEYGPLAETIKEAIRIWHAQKADGVSLTDRITGMEQTLRLSWPEGREWKYLCPTCHDTGLALKLCTKAHRCDGLSTRSESAYTSGGKYTRLCAHDPGSSYEHEYGEPCFCQKGNRFKPHAVQSDPESFTKSTYKPRR